MPFRIGLLLYPAFAFFALRSKKSPPDVFFKAGAVSPATAVRPEGIGVTDPRIFNDYVRSGLIVRLPDGLCYLDEARYRRRRARGIAAIAVLGVLLAAFAVFMLWE